MNLVNLPLPKKGVASMKLKAIALVVGLASLIFAAQAIAQAPVVKHDDGQADGKKSLGGSGEIIGFTLPDATSKLAGIRIHGSRYGLPEAPKESFLVYVLSPDMKEVVRTEMAPYSLFERGPEKWVDVKFGKPIEVPKDFWIAVDFRAGRTKGVYVSYDGSTDGKHSRIGLPGMEATPCDFAGDWMIEAVLAK
jgi:RNA polymerase sigma-70 factor (ECF subfamily)